MKNEDFLYTETDGAKLPVLVCGNKEAKTFIIYLAGGPGESCLSHHFSVAMNKLEEKYRIVYYDQRGAGRSKGKIVKERMTLEQSVKDTDHIIDHIKQKYNNPDIILLGHSWGGALGTAYLLDEEHQQKVKGWIELDGAHNWKGQEEKSRLYVMDYANQHKEEEGWQEALAWYKKNPVINASNIILHAIYLIKSNAYLPVEAQGSTFHTISEMKLNLSYYYNTLYSQYRVYKRAKTMNIYSLNLTDDMDKIKIPSLIVWGEKDYRISKEFAYEAFNAIGSSEKELVLLPHSGHWPVAADISLYTNSIDHFIKSLYTSSMDQ